MFFTSGSVWIRSKIIIVVYSWWYDVGRSQSLDRCGISNKYWCARVFDLRRKYLYPPARSPALREKRLDDVLFAYRWPPSAGKSLSVESLSGPVGVVNTHSRGEWRREPRERRRRGYEKTSSQDDSRRIQRKNAGHGGTFREINRVYIRTCLTRGAENRFYLWQMSSLNK